MSAGELTPEDQQTVPAIFRSIRPASAPKEAAAEPTKTPPAPTQANEHPSVAWARAMAARYLGLDQDRACELTLENWEAVP